MRLSIEKKPQTFGHIWCQKSGFSTLQLRTTKGIARILSSKNKTYSPTKTISDFVEDKGYDIYFSPIKNSNFVKIDLIERIKDTKKIKIKPKIFVGKYKTISSFSVKDIMLIDFNQANKLKPIKKTYSNIKSFIKKTFFKKSTSKA